MQVRQLHFLDRCHHQPKKTWQSAFGWRRGVVDTGLQTLRTPKGAGAEVQMTAQALVFLPQFDQMLLKNYFLQTSPFYSPFSVHQFFPHYFLCPTHDSTPPLCSFAIDDLHFPVCLVLNVRCPESAWKNRTCMVRFNCPRSLFFSHTCRFVSVHPHIFKDFYAKLQ